MSDRAVWLHDCGGRDALLGKLVVQSLQRSGFIPFHLNGSPSSGAGVLLFDHDTPELWEALKEYSQNGLKHVLVIAVTRRVLTGAMVWDLLRTGASDVFAWDQLNDPGAAVASRLERWQQIDELVQSSLVRESIVGQSGLWISVLRRAVELARFSNGSVLIVGQSGTGKELIARLIHSLDARPVKRDLVIADCTTILPELSGSEFFGHERGAFTSAVAMREGAFALADGGTLFLDEVGELPLGLQAELLRVVQERTYKRVGGNTWKNTSFRLICATNRNLTEEQAQGRFRRDFFYRIAAWTCYLPPLCERREDILPLTLHFLRNLFPGQNLPDLDMAVRDYLITREYPGNVRELRQVITRMAHRHVGTGPFTAGDIAEEDRPAAAGPARKNWHDDGFGLAIRRAMSLGIKLREISETAVETAIKIATEEEGVTLRQAAEKLGVTNRALQMRRASQRKRTQIRPRESPV